MSKKINYITLGSEPAARRAASATGRGRQARTRGVSLTPAEQALVERYQALSGRSFTEQVREQVVAKLPAAIAFLEEVEASGMAIGTPSLDYEVRVIESAEERERLYADDFVSG